MKGPENTHERTRKRRQRALILEIDGSSFHYHLCSRSVRTCGQGVAKELLTVGVVLRNSHAGQQTFDVTSSLGQGDCDSWLEVPSPEAKLRTYIFTSLAMF